MSKTEKTKRLIEDVLEVHQVSTPDAMQVMTKVVIPKIFKLKF